MTLKADLSAQTVFVTGASGGLGLHFANTLARAGARTILSARRVDLVEKAAVELSGEGCSTLAVRCDVSDLGSVEQALDQAAGWAGAPVNTLINNAGIADGAPLIKSDDESFARVMDVNLHAANRTARVVAQRLVAAKQAGTIINIASILGERVIAGVAAYAASKAALIQLTRSMALEWARYDIRVNALAPGYILTDINREFFESDAGQAMIKRIPQRRLGQPKDLDGALLLLASDASAHMTGSVITVDGGHSHNAL